MQKHRQCNLHSSRWSCSMSKMDTETPEPPPPLKFILRPGLFQYSGLTGPTPLRVIFFYIFNFQNPDLEWLQYLQGFTPLRLETAHKKTSGSEWPVISNTCAPWTNENLYPNHNPQCTSIDNKLPTTTTR